MYILHMKDSATGLTPVRLHDGTGGEMLLNLTFALTYIFATYKWGDWRNWKLYYPTILFYCFGDILAFALFHEHPLWLYSMPGIPHLFHELFVVAIMYPCGVILYLSNYPKALAAQFVYILFWTCLYTFLEWIGTTTGNFLHLNGWTLFWSFILYLIMFPTFRLHQKHPLLALCILFSGLTVVFFLFDVPLKDIK